MKKIYPNIIYTQIPKRRIYTQIIIYTQMPPPPLSIHAMEKREVSSIQILSNSLLLPGSLLMTLNNKYNVGKTH